VRCPWRDAIRVLRGSGRLGEGPVGADVVEAEGQEPFEVHGSGPVREPETVGRDAAEADPPVAARDELGDGAFDHGAVTAVGGLPVGVGRVVAGGGELVVVGVGW
jgi:hypothetical protein